MGAGDLTLVHSKSSKQSSCCAISSDGGMCFEYLRINRHKDLKGVHFRCAYKQNWEKGKIMKALPYREAFAATGSGAYGRLL